VPERLLRAVVVDDEQLAREELCYVLDEVGGVEVVAEAGNGLEALDAIGRLEPDLVFLDVQMPGLTGFEVARKLADREPPVTVIFVTAYDQHAIQAFEVNAVDYLLKPIDSQRVETAVVRARRRLAPEAPLNDQLERIVQLVEGRKTLPEQVAVKVGDRLLLVRPRTSFLPRWRTTRLLSWLGTRPGRATSGRSMSSRRGSTLRCSGVSTDRTS